MIDLLADRDSTQFSDLSSNTHRRNNFINNVNTAVTKYGFDGVDIDWVRMEDAFLRSSRCCRHRGTRPLTSTFARNIPLGTVSLATLKGLMTPHICSAC